MLHENANCIAGKFNSNINVFWHYVQGVPKEGLPFEVKRQCRMFEFECLNSLMSPGMRKTLELGIFMLTLRNNLRILGLIGDLKHSNSNMHAALALDFKG